MLEMIQNGVTSPSVMARRLKISPNHARVILWQLRKKGLCMPAKATASAKQKSIQIRLSDLQRASLERQAQSKGISAEKLAQVMLDVIIKDHLYDAIIDGDVHAQ